MALSPLDEHGKRQSVDPLHPLHRHDVGRTSSRSDRARLSLLSQGGRGSSAHVALGGPLLPGGSDTHSRPATHAARMKAAALDLRQRALRRPRARAPKGSRG
jgi:hypothetical protein